MSNTSLHRGKPGPCLLAGGLVLGALLIGAPGPASLNHLTGNLNNANPTQEPKQKFGPLPSVISMPKPVAYLYPYNCDRPKDAEQDNLCIERRAAQSAKHQVTWAQRTFWLGGAGTIAVVLTLVFTAIAARAATRGAGAAQLAAEVAQRALTELERPLVFMKIAEDGVDCVISNNEYGQVFKFAKTVLAFENYGRTPAILTRLEYKPLVVATNQRVAPIDPRVISGRELPVGIVAAIGAPYTEYVLLGRMLRQQEKDALGRDSSEIRIVGFVRYDDIFSNHYITGFSVVFDPNGNRFVIHGGPERNYNRKEEAADIPAPSAPA